MISIFFASHSIKDILTWMVKMYLADGLFVQINPSNAEATFIKCTRMQKIMKIILTKSSGYSYESPGRELSDEYPFAMVSIISKVFWIFLYRSN